MISSFVNFCLIPECHWDISAISPSSEIRIAKLAAEALTVERRIQKEVNLDNERRRYSLLCWRIEDEILKSALLQRVNSIEEISAVLDSQKLPAIAVDRTYIDILRAILDEDSPPRLGATFFPPSEVRTHLDVISEIISDRGIDGVAAFKICAELFRWAAAAGCGIVELQYHFAFGHPSDAESCRVVKELYEQQQQSVHIQSPVSTLHLSAKDLHEVEAFRTESKQRQVHILSTAVIKAINRKEPANFSNRSNDVIAEVLHRFVYVPASQSTTPLNLRVVYADGSEGRPLRIRCLILNGQTEADLEQSSTLRAVLMSMRHVDLDANVDMAWFRNREVSKTRTLAETDEYCYQTTRAQLEGVLREGPLNLHMHHTGFEPAVIGFYRAVVDVLLANGPLGILPYYYRGKDRFELGNWWR